MSALTLALVSIAAFENFSQDDVRNDLKQLSSDVAHLEDFALEKEKERWTYESVENPPFGTLRHMLNNGPAVDMPMAYYNNAKGNMPNAHFWQFLWDAAFGVYEPDEIQKKSMCSSPADGALKGPKGLASGGNHQSGFECVMAHGDIDAGDDHVSWALWSLPTGNTDFKLGDVQIDCVVAFKGTDSVADVKTDLAELNGAFDGWMTSNNRVANALQGLMATEPPHGCTSLVATGHSLGGATAQNLALYEGVRAFVFSGPGPFIPKEADSTTFHSFGLAAIEASATIYNSPDRIAFASPHIGDRMCDVQQHTKKGMLWDSAQGDGQKAMEYHNGNHLHQAWFQTVRQLYTAADNTLGLSAAMTTLVPFRGLWKITRQVAHHMGSHKSWGFAWDGATCFDADGSMKFGEVDAAQHNGFWKVAFSFERQPYMF
jgi:pimeloyl-ACP methyl ester carboxylesterase